MQYSLKQAAEVTGKGKTTIHRDIKAGRLSASKDEHGRVWIDASELHRLYPPAIPESVPGNIPNGTRVALLEQEVEHLKAMLERERQVSDDLARRLDTESEERRKLTALLTHQPASTPAAAERSFVDRLANLFKK
jgi:predicted site-specific integrase-resolvase